MFSAFKRLFARAEPAEPADPIADALRDGRKEEALRLIADEGVWLPYRDPKEQEDGSLSVRYFDTEDCFPVFSSLQRVLPFLQQRGVIDGTKVVSVPAHQVAAEFFSANLNLARSLTLNPGSDAEWKFEPAEFETIVARAKKNG